MVGVEMNNSQFGEERNSSADIQERLRMEIHDLYHAGPPDDDANLIQLLEDALLWIMQAKREYSIPDNWRIEEEE